MNISKVKIIVKTILSFSKRIVWSTSIGYLSKANIIVLIIMQRAMNISK